MQLDLGEVFRQLDLEADDPDLNDRVVYQGGPVHPDRGFVLHHPVRDYGSTIQICDEVAVSTSRENALAGSRAVILKIPRG